MNPMISLDEVYSDYQMHVTLISDPLAKEESFILIIIVGGIVANFYSSLQRKQMPLNEV